MPPRRGSVSGRLHDAWGAWPYWMLRYLALVALLGVGVALWLISHDGAAVLAIAPAVVAISARGGISSIGRRALILATLLSLGFAFVSWVPWQVFALALAAGAGTMFRRFVGSLSPRFVGVPRPNMIGESRALSEGTSDDAEYLVDSFEAMWGSSRPGGPHHGKRAAHAHGSGARGTFRPAAKQSAAVPLFAHDREMVAVMRFSNFWRWDERNDSRRTPRGLAIRIMPPAEVECGAGIDFVLLDVRRFPVNSRDDLAGLAQRWGQWPRILMFWLVGRTRAAALGRTISIWSPRSYLDRSYHGVNTFLWAGEPVRFMLVPVPKQKLPRDRTTDPRWRLDRDLKARLGRGTQTFELRLVRGRGIPEHAQLNAQIAWPKRMPFSTLGTLQVTDYVDPSLVEAISFNPHHLPVGVEPSSDEILMARRAAHAESLLRRCPI